MTELTFCEPLGWIPITIPWGMAMRTRLPDGSEGPNAVMGGWVTCPGHRDGAHHPVVMEWRDEFGDPPPEKRQGTPADEDERGPRPWEDAGPGMTLVARTVIAEARAEVWSRPRSNTSGFTALMVWPLSILKTRNDWGGWISMLLCALRTGGCRDERAAEIVAPLARRVFLK